MKEETVPRLDLAPRLKRPLSLWNPLDYIRLLYWAFFFPQAIRWYVQKFGKPEYQDAQGYKAVKEVLRNDPVQRKLVIQAIITLIAASCVTALVLSALGVPIDWLLVAFGVVLGVVLGVAASVALGVMRGVAFGVAAGVAFGVALGAVSIVVFGMVGAAAYGVAVGIVAHVVFGRVESVPGGVAVEMVVGLARNVAFGTVFGVAFSVTIGVAKSVAGNEAGSVAEAVSFGLVFIAAINVTFFRLFDYLFLLLPFNLAWKPGKKNRLRQASRLVLLPLPGLQRQVEKWLTQDWNAGLYNVNQLLAYTLQFIPVVKAMNVTLANFKADIMLSRTTSLVDRPFDWDLIRFCSSSLDKELRQRAIERLNIFIPARWKERRQLRFQVILWLDTPARAACAGFWFWHEKEAAKAAKAFAVVKDLRHGPELYGVARTIGEGQKTTDLHAIAALEQETEWMNTLPHPELRPGTLQVLRTLRSAAGEAQTAHHSQSVLNRSTAIGRAVADLTRLLETGESICPEPEWPLIKEIAENWRYIFSEAGGVVGEEILRQPVPNPYEGYSGLPVIGSTFIGRADIMQQIENYWATSGKPVCIILYGHRRMGKTSILRNLSHFTGSNTLYVYLDMQNVGWVDHTGQLLLDFAEAIHRIAAEFGLQTGPPPEETRYTNLGTGRRSLNALLNKLDSQMTEPKRLVLAIDEFELIETGIKEKRIDAGLLPYLRSIHQKYQWLGLIFAGLHTLDEMGHDYKSAFYGQAEYIRVGYMEYNDALRLITQPHPDFALEYTPELREELYRLTAGQPFLIQRLCWELVTRWNERFLKQGETTPRTLTLDDLAPVLTPDFFHSAGYYFDGVWSNVTKNEHTLMRIMAQREKGTWTLAELAKEVETIPSFKETNALEKTMDLLRRHDVIAEEKEGTRIASELLRRWLSQEED
ncbi:MAG: AAA family ATPase [Candidatus Aminicenantes bacterium]|nr:AAA family ATPase [Candidatus Aminicenantes bacterium]NIO81143.1 AAA family ATPase [Candidatus Aminicenantes bacterium]NIT23036.1 AAA family ATPase [Candidatus Aminicenantes bacterium]